MTLSEGFGSWFPLPSLVASNLWWDLGMWPPPYSWGHWPGLHQRLGWRLGPRASLPQGDQPSNAVLWSCLARVSVPNIHSRPEPVCPLSPWLTDYLLPRAKVWSCRVLWPSPRGTQQGGFGSGESRGTGGTQRQRVTLQGSLQVPMSCKLSWVRIGLPCGGPGVQLTLLKLHHS